MPHPISPFMQNLTSLCEANPISNYENVTGFILSCCFANNSSQTYQEKIEATGFNPTTTLNATTHNFFSMFGGCELPINSSSISNTTGPNPIFYPLACAANSTADLARIMQNLTENCSPGEETRNFRFLAFIALVLSLFCLVNIVISNRKTTSPLPA